MNTITFFVLACALLAAIALFRGISSMAHGGAADQRSSHLYMFRRVGWQALAILFVFIGVLAQH